MYTIILIIHIIGAFASVGIIAALLFYIATRNQASKHLRRGVFIVPALQLLSGIGMVAINPMLSMKEVCVRGAVFMAVIVGLYYVSCKTSRTLASKSDYNQ
jgi:uncharacterized membrane protein SirB2